MYEEKHFQDLVNKVTFSGDQYVYEHYLSPGILFYKYLAKKPEGTMRQLTTKAGKLKLWMPDTIVFNDGLPMWIYSSADGHVFRTETFIDQHVLQKIGNMDNKEELVAVLKRAGTNFKTGRKCINTVALSTNDLIKRLTEFT
jgi:hypothetical protein